MLWFSIRQGGIPSPCWTQISLEPLFFYQSLFPLLEGKPKTHYVIVLTLVARFATFSFYVILISLLISESDFSIVIIKIKN